MLRFDQLIALALCWICDLPRNSASFPHDRGYLMHKAKSVFSSDPAQICIVVRTYQGQGYSSGAGLLELLTSFQRQAHRNWEAIIVVLDSKPFYDLSKVINELGDDRVWVYAEWIGKQFTGNSDIEEPIDYHGLLYDLTDAAIGGCNPKSRWVLVTNGDNEYAKGAFEIIASSQSDIVAFDYYSRYQRITGPSCFRFSKGPGLPPCKANLLKWCHTDLGANALNWPRLIEEGWKFGGITSSDGILASDSFDGLMAQVLVAAGWQVQAVNNSCMFEHDPSPQRCTRLGGVWDDTLLRSTASPGGSCISRAEADSSLAAQAGIEEVEVELSEDSHLNDFQDAWSGEAATIRCLRDRNTTEAEQFAWTMFAANCSAQVDLDARGQRGQ